MSLLTHDKWSVHVLNLRNEKAFAVWTLLQQHPSLFDDEASRKYNDWLRFIDTPGLVFLGVYENPPQRDNASILVGLIHLDFSPGQGNVEVHLMFFDRKPAEKTELIKQLIPIVLEMFPRIKRLTTTVPAIFSHTWRLARRIGMHWVGTNHQAVSISGKRWDSFTYELLREEVR